MDSVAMPVLENGGFGGAGMGAGFIDGLVLGFCGSLLGMYENLNKDADEQQLIKLEK